MPDKYTAVWVSHTSISDFQKCPRGYFLKHVYKDPKTNHKIQIMTPALALGQAVHDTLENLSQLPKDQRFDTPIMERFHESWKKVSGKRGGFLDEKQEDVMKRRGEEIMTRVYNNPGPLKKLSVKIQKDLPYFWLSESDNIILCGRVDWLEYLPESDSVHIIDFKTGKQKEDENSLQLPIYYLLVNRCQKRNVSKASYWYLQYDDNLTEKELPDLDESLEEIIKVAREIKLARQLERFKCPREEGCYVCLPHERILNGEGEFVGEGEFNTDIYILEQESPEEEQEAVIL